MGDVSRPLKPQEKILNARGASTPLYTSDIASPSPSLSPSSVCLHSSLVFYSPHLQPRGDSSGWERV